MTRDEKLRELMAKWRRNAVQSGIANAGPEIAICAHELEALLNAPSEAPAVTPPVTHEQVLGLADHIFSQKVEEQRQCFIDIFDLIDWEALASSAKLAEVNSCGIWCPNCGAHLRGPAEVSSSKD